MSEKTGLTEGHTKTVTKENTSTGDENVEPTKPPPTPKAQEKPQEPPEIKDPPPDRLNVKFTDPDGTDMEKDVLMSAGLVRRLAAIAASLDDFSRLYTDPTIQEVFILEVIKGRNKRGEEAEEELKYTLEDYEMTIAMGDEIAKWATDHVLHFFTNTAALVMKEATDKTSALAGLADSMNGLESFLETKQSVGPSEQS